MYDAVKNAGQLGKISREARAESAEWGQDKHIIAFISPFQHFHPFIAHS